MPYKSGCAQWERCVVQHCLYILRIRLGSETQVSPRLTLLQKASLIQLSDNEGCSQAELADLFGVSQQAVAKILGNRQQILTATDATVDFNRTRLPVSEPTLMMDEEISLGNSLAASVFLKAISGLGDARPPDLPSVRNFVGRMTLTCTACGAKFWPDERPQSSKKTTFQACCAHAKWSEPPLTVSPEIKMLLTMQHGSSKHFHERIRNFNYGFAFSSTNARTFKFPQNGPYLYKIQGAVISRFNTAAIPDANDRPRYGQLYVLDGEQAKQHRLSEPANTGLDEGTKPVLLKQVLVFKFRSDHNARRSNASR